MAKQTKIKSKKELTDEAQKSFNNFIRARDADDGCISCDKDKDWDGIYHAGHYLPTTCSNFRFDERNVHKQCMQCNTFKHGNLIRYRQNLVKKIGVEAVEELENGPETRRYSEQELIDIKEKYVLKLRELKELRSQK